MKNNFGHRIESFPFEHLTKVKDILYYDGPILSHFSDLSEEEHYFFLWVDYDEVCNRWLVFKVSERDIFDYLKGYESLHGLFFSNKNDFLFLVDIDSDVNYHNILLIRHDEIPSSYIPDENSFFNSNPPLIYKSLIEKFTNDQHLNIDYLDALRSSAMFLKISPATKKHDTIVSAYDASSFLKDISDSYLNFAEIQFIKEFNQLYTSNDKLTKARKQISQQLEPRLVQVGISSFGVGLATDFITNSTQKEIREWKKGIIEQFKNQIIDIDYSSDVQIDNLKEKFNEEERYLIFKPLFKVLKSKSYTVSITDYKFTEKKKLKSYSSNAEQKLVTYITNNEPKETDFELVNIVIEKPVNESISQLSKKSLNQGLLFSQIINDFDLRIDQIIYRDDIINLSVPFIIKAKFKNNLYITEIQELDIKLTTKDKDKILESFHKALYEKISFLSFADEDQLTEKEKEQKKYLSNFIAI